MLRVGFRLSQAYSFEVWCNCKDEHGKRWLLVQLNQVTKRKGRTGR